MFTSIVITMNLRNLLILYKSTSILYMATYITHSIGILFYCYAYSINNNGLEELSQYKSVNKITRIHQAFPLWFVYIRYIQTYSYIDTNELPYNFCLDQCIFLLQKVQHLYLRKYIYSFLKLKNKNTSALRSSISQDFFIVKFVILFHF